MKWELELTGDAFDLNFLASRFQNDPRVAREGEAWYLSSSDIDEASTSGDAHERGRRFLPRLNGAARLDDRRHRSVALSGRIVDAEDGSHSAVVLAGSVNLRSRVTARITVEGGQILEVGSRPADDASRLVSLADTDLEVARVLELMDSERPDQDRLFKAFERIRDDMGGEKGLKSRGLASGRDLSAFGAWANRPDVSGSDARHEVVRGDAPARVMTDGEAWDFMSRLVRSWAVARGNN